MDPFNPDNFRMDPSERPKAKQSRRVPRHKAGQWFIKGPIPGAWVREAVRHSVGARVAYVLWYLAGVTKCATVIPTHADWDRFGISRYVGRRGIDSLEDAGLVRVDRHRGRCPIVTLLDVSE